MKRGSGDKLPTKRAARAATSTCEVVADSCNALKTAFTKGREETMCVLPATVTQCSEAQAAMHGLHKDDASTCTCGVSALQPVAAGMLSGLVLQQQT